MKRIYVGLAALAGLTGCASNPNTTNRGPVPQWDGASHTGAANDRERPGYLPAYPPYERNAPYPPGVKVDNEGS